MVIYKAKDYQDMSRKAANIISSTDYYETKLCAWTCHRFFPSRNLQTIDRMV